MTAPTDRSLSDLLALGDRPEILDCALAIEGDECRAVAEPAAADGERRGDRIEPDLGMARQMSGETPGQTPKPHKVQRTAERPRHPNRTRPISNTPNSSQAISDSTVFCSNSCVNKLVTKTNPVNKASVKRAKPAPISRMKSCFSRLCVSGMTMTVR